MMPAPVGWPYANRFLSKTTPMVKMILSGKELSLQMAESLSSHAQGVSYIGARSSTVGGSSCLNAAAGLENPANQRGANVSRLE